MNYHIYHSFEPYKLIIESPPCGLLAFGPPPQLLAENDSNPYEWANNICKKLDLQALKKEVRGSRRQIIMIYNNRMIDRLKDYLEG